MNLDEKLNEVIDGLEARIDVAANPVGRALVEGLRVADYESMQVLKGFLDICKEGALTLQQTDPDAAEQAALDAECDVFETLDLVEKAIAEQRQSAH